MFGVVDSEGSSCTREEYIAQNLAGRAEKGLSCVQHFFDKLLRLPAMMTTDTGRALASKRLSTQMSYLAAVAEELCDAGDEDGEVLKRKLSRFISQDMQ